MNRRNLLKVLGTIPFVGLIKENPKVIYVSHKFRYHPDVMCDSKFENWTLKYPNPQLVEQRIEQCLKTLKSENFP